jgi:predicted RecA/RadA family phage recombinase
MKSLVLCMPEVIEVINGTGGTLTSGSVITVGGMKGVVIADILDTESGSVRIGGVVSLTKKAAITPAQGSMVFWDTTPGEVSDTVTDGLPLGTVFALPGASDAEVKVHLNNRVPAATEAAVATADGSDPTTTQALANALKAAHNSLLAKLKTAGIVAGL